MFLLLLLASFASDRGTAVASLIMQGLLVACKQITCFGWPPKQASKALWFKLLWRVGEIACAELFCSVRSHKDGTLRAGRTDPALRTCSTANSRELQLQVGLTAVKRAGPRWMSSQQHIVLLPGRLGCTAGQTGIDPSRASTAEFDPLGWRFLWSWLRHGRPLESCKLVARYPVWLGI